MVKLLNTFLQNFNIYQVKECLIKISQLHVKAYQLKSRIWNHHMFPWCNAMFYLFIYLKFYWTLNPVLSLYLPVMVELHLLPEFLLDLAICRFFSTLSGRISLHLSPLWTRRAPPGLFYMTLKRRLFLVPVTIIVR